MTSDEESANPLFLAWVKEWLDKAREHSSKGVTTYRNAYNSLKACPISFQHPSQLQQLKGFGPKLCDRLTELLKKHCEENGLPMPEKPRPVRAGEGGGDGDDASRPAKKQRRTKPYVPALRSGAYALVLGLAEQDAPVGLTKAELIEVAQPHCDASFSAPSDPTKFYTAWSSMKTLIEKELVVERGRPLRRYTLTDEGWDVAGRIQGSRDLTLVAGAVEKSVAASARTLGGGGSRSTNRSPSVDGETRSAYTSVVADGNGTLNNSALPDFQAIPLAPGSFTVHLLLDTREVRAKTDRDYMQEELAKKGVAPIVRALELGDACWVAKCNDPSYLSRMGAEGDEIVLDYIAERKRLDDLIGSIKDGRFHEQKFRLNRSGVKHIIYIVEEMALDPLNKSKYEEMVQSAMASTQVVNGYFLKQTQKMDDTIRYLTRMTMLLKKQYEKRTLYVIPTRVLTATNYLPLLDHLRRKEPSKGYYVSYPAFASLASKSEMMTLRDVYLKMLMCTRQVTGEKAIEMQQRWKTPYELVKAFKGCGPGEEGKKRKRDLVFGQMGGLYGRKKIAKVLSHRIAEVWGDV